MIELIAYVAGIMGLTVLAAGLLGALAAQAEHARDSAKQEAAWREWRREMNEIDCDWSACDTCGEYPGHRTRRKGLQWCVGCSLAVGRKNLWRCPECRTVFHKSCAP